MPRNFDAIDDVIFLSLGATGGVWGPGSVATILRWVDPGTAAVIFQIGAASGGSRFSFGLNSATGTMNCTPGSTTVSSITAVAVNNEWCFLAATKATGAVAPRFHMYRYSTNTWIHENGGATANNTSSISVAGRIGNHTAVNLEYGGDIAVLGYYGIVLSDAQVEAMAYSLLPWVIPGAKGIWLLDQATTSQKVIDISGGGAGEGAITGTTVSTSNVPVFSYGHQI